MNEVNLAMRDLFTIDKKNYKDNGSIGKRPSVRGIILKDGKIAMIHSKKYGYYKLPGGGIEPGESYEETLIREVREESGLLVKEHSIKEYGYVRRIEKGKIDDIFIQDNYYFICDVEDEKVEQKLDEYEEDEQYTLEFVFPNYAIEINEKSIHKGENEIQTFNKGMLERENRLLRMVIEEFSLQEGIKG